MDANDGQVLSLVSLPNFNINKRQNILDKNYINKITKGVYELDQFLRHLQLLLLLIKK